MDERARIFEEERPRLMGIAYRMLGSVSDAQDVVQDTYIKWAYQQGAHIENPGAWLSRVCTNRCLDRLKSAEKMRLEYVGPWLPDHIQTGFAPSAEDRIEAASSLTTAFLLLLERLTPKERAAYLLHDIFGMSFDDVASALEMKPSTCRKLAARARRFVSEERVRHVPDETHQAHLLDTFTESLKTGNTDRLGRVLHADATVRADSGGRVVAIRRIIEGAAQLRTFISSVLAPAWADMEVSPQVINGMQGLVIAKDNDLHAAVSFSYDPMGNIRHVFIVRHPEKLARLKHSSMSVASKGKLSVR